MNAKLEITDNMKRYPHLLNIKEGLTTLKTLKERLEKRKKLIKTDFKEKSTHDQNEIEIILIETEIKIVKLNKSITERTDYYNDYFKQLTKMLPEVIKNFKSVRLEALNLVKDKTHPNHKKLKAELDTNNNKSDEWNINYELKFRHYLEIKELIKTPAPTKELTKA